MTAVAKIEQHNPIGTDGFEFVEFTAPNDEGIQQLRQLFTAMGFTETAKHRSKQVWLPRLRRLLEQLPVLQERHYHRHQRQ